MRVVGITVGEIKTVIRDCLFYLLLEIHLAPSNRNPQGRSCNGDDSKEVRVWAFPQLHSNEAGLGKLRRNGTRTPRRDLIEFDKFVRNCHEAVNKWLMLGARVMPIVLKIFQYFVGHQNEL